MSFTTIGTDEGYAEPGVYGESNPFPYENLLAEPYRRLALNRLAMLNNRTVDYTLPPNDVIASHRAVYSSRQAARSPRILAAFHPGAGQGYANAKVPVSARGATGTINELTGKAIASPGDLTRTPMAALSSAAGLVSVNPGTGRGNDIAANFLSFADSDLTTAVRFLVRATDANNYIAMFRQAAGTLRVERNVAGVPATERDIAIATTTPATGNAYGIRLTGTSAQVFLNGTKLDDWTLDAAAQGLAGTLVGVLLAAGTHVYAGVSYFEVYSLTPVSGV